MNQLEDKDTIKKLSLFAITWPIFIEMFLHILMGSADTLMLSRVSDEAVAAVGMANQIVFFMIILFGFVGQGTSVVVAQYLGAKKIMEASHVSAIAISINLVFGLLISVVVVMFHKTFLERLNIPQNLMDDASAYLVIVGGTIFTQALLLTVSAIIRTNGFTRDAMFVSMGMNMLNVIGNYLFIYGAFGFPQLEVTGVAISTAVSRTIGMIALFILLYRRLQVRIEWADYFNMNTSYIKKILKIGLPSAGEHLSYNTSQMMITVFITFLGTAALATRVYTFNIMMFILLFGLAIGQGTQIIVGHMIGAGQKEEAYNQLLRSLKWSLVTTTGVVLVVAAFRESLIGIFTDDPSIIAVGASLLLLCIILEPGRTFNLVVISSLRAAGDAQFPVFIGILSMWGISVPVSYYLGIHQGYGLLGIWIAFSIDEWLRGILMYLRWKSRAWEKKALVDKDESDNDRHQGEKEAAVLQ
jgi:putative MATE family efflux protein